MPKANIGRKAAEDTADEDTAAEDTAAEDTAAEDTAATFLVGNYENAKRLYSAYGVDTEQALRRLESVSLSLHCWQGDDIRGFEPQGEHLFGGGIQATGNYPGKARTADELRDDLAMALALIPGSHRVSLHASYAETGGRRVERDGLTPELFSKWIAWAREADVKLDFNGTFFAHPLAQSGFTLSSRDKAVREFWINHGMRCREIGAVMGQELHSPCIVNLWIPDGYKDTPVDRFTPRALLKDSLDRIFEKEISSDVEKDAVECKLFGIGSESYVVGSHEFYLGYALRNSKIVCLDMGHFHPTELIADKVSSILTYANEILLHVSRGVRWDSDHVVILNDDVRALTSEVQRGNMWERVHFALDYFDASINRIAAWAIGARALLKSILISLLEPSALIQQEEANGRYTERLALLEETKSLPWGSVWDKYCCDQSVPAGRDWLPQVQEYEQSVLATRT